MTAVSGQPPVREARLGVAIAFCPSPPLLLPDVEGRPAPETAELRRAWERMHPLGRIGQPIDVAWGALFLACDESSWITGQCLSIDGGISCSVLPE